MIKIVDKRWLEYRAKSIETHNLKQKQRSRAWISILQHLNACILCVYDNYVEIDYDIYKSIRKGELDA